MGLQCNHTLEIAKAHGKFATWWPFCQARGLQQDLGPSLGWIWGHLCQESCPVPGCIWYPPTPQLLQQLNVFHSSRDLFFQPSLSEGFPWAKPEFGPHTPKLWTEQNPRNHGQCVSWPHPPHGAVEVPPFLTLGVPQVAQEGAKPSCSVFQEEGQSQALG